MEGGPIKGEEAYSGWRVDPSKGRRHIVGGGCITLDPSKGRRHMVGGGCITLALQRGGGI